MIARVNPSRCRFRNADDALMCHRRDPSELSGGMQQLFAAHLFTNPSVLLMDEPFAALEAMTQNQINIEFLTIWRHTKKTALLMTHSVSEAVYFIDYARRLRSALGKQT
jgi:ABC-type nitrate/sulfonate/bicarbonate transport system ATPase subunit